MGKLKLNGSMDLILHSEVIMLAQVKWDIVVLSVATQKYIQSKRFKSTIKKTQWYLKKIFR